MVGGGRVGASGVGAVQGIVPVPAHQSDAHRRRDGGPGGGAHGVGSHPEGRGQGGVAGPIAHVVVLVDLAEGPGIKLGGVLPEVCVGSRGAGVLGAPGPEAAGRVREVGPLGHARVGDELERHHAGHGAHGGAPSRGGRQVGSGQELPGVGIQGQDEAAQLGAGELGVHLGVAGAAPQEHGVPQHQRAVLDAAKGGGGGGEAGLGQEGLRCVQGGPTGGDTVGGEAGGLIGHQGPLEGGIEGVVDVQGIVAAPPLAEAEDGHGPLGAVHHASASAPATGGQVQVVDHRGAIHHEPVGVAVVLQVVQVGQEVRG